MRQGRLPPQTLGAAGQPVRPAPLVPPSASERELFAAYRNAVEPEDRHRRCPCRDYHWAHWTADEIAELEQRQRQLAAATIVAERAAIEREAVA